MRKFFMLLLVMMLAVLAFAGDKKDKNKDYKTGKLVKVNTADLQSADYKVTDNRNSPVGGMSNQSSGGMPNMAGGSFSNAPAHFIRYQAVIETETEFIQVSKDREISMNQPELKQNADVQWKFNGNKQVEVVDSRGKKWDMLIVKRFPKDATATDAPAGSTPAPKQ